MKELIKQTITLNLLDNPSHPVNARELHAFLEVETPFSMWIKRRIEEYGFIEGQDFTDHKFVNGKATQIDYFLTLDMGKELAMVERNDKGKEARRYFLDCEKKLKEQRQPKQLEYTPEERANIAFKSLYEIAQLVKVPESFALQECAKMATRASGCDITPLITQAAGMDKVPNKDVMLEPTELGKKYGLSGKSMNKKLAELELQVKANGEWIVTSKGEPLCERHASTATAVAWAVANKSGYNLKWNWQAIDELMQNNAL